MSKEWSIFEPSEFKCTQYEYQINGKSYSRVTQILTVIAKQQLMNWMAKQGTKQVNEILTNRQTIGTVTHKLIEHTIKKVPFNLGTYENEIQDNVKLFKIIQNECHLIPEALEQHLWSNKYGYAGTADYIGWYKSCTTFFKYKSTKPKFQNSAWVIGDWKTSKAIYPSYWYQLAAYVKAFEELTGQKVDGAFIACFRNGKCYIEEKTYKELEELFNIFKAALVIYDKKYRKIIHNVSLEVD